MLCFFSSRSPARHCFAARTSSMTCPMIVGPMATTVSRYKRNRTVKEITAWSSASASLASGRSFTYFITIGVSRVTRQVGFLLGALQMRGNCGHELQSVMWSSKNITSVFFRLPTTKQNSHIYPQIPYNYFFWTISFAPHATYNYFFWIISFASHATYNYFFWTISCATHSTYNYFFWIISIATHATYNYFFCTNLLQNMPHIYIYIYIYIHTPQADRSLKDKAKIKLLGMSIIARNSKHW